MPTHPEHRWYVWAMAFRSCHLVRFADIDRAGIVYYPRFFDYFHRAFEDFFTHEVKLPYHRLIDERRVGFPIVHVECDFRRPLQHGDELTIELSTLKVGARSVTMRYRVFRPGTDAPAAEATVSQVCVDMDSFRPRPIPDEVRAVFEAHREPANAGAGT